LVDIFHLIVQIPHELFWQRFLFRKALLEDEEARKQAKQRRLEEEKQRIETSAKQSKHISTHYKIFAKGGLKWLQQTLHC
jgi:hypothetical protein